MTVQSPEATMRAIRELSDEEREVILKTVQFDSCISFFWMRTSREDVVLYMKKPSRDAQDELLKAEILSSWSGDWDRVLDVGQFLMVQEISCTTWRHVRKINVAILDKSKEITEPVQETSPAWHHVLSSVGAVMEESIHYPWKGEQQ